MSKGRNIHTAPAFRRRAVPLMAAETAVGRRSRHGSPNPVFPFFICIGRAGALGCAKSHQMSSSSSLPYLGRLAVVVGLWSTQTNCRRTAASVPGQPLRRSRHGTYRLRPALKAASNDKCR